MEVEGFFRNLGEKQAALVVALDNFFDVTISDSSFAEKNEAVARLTDAASLLAGQISTQDKPTWLDSLIAQGQRRKQHPDHGGVWGETFKKIKTLETAIRKHKWSRSQDDVVPLIDFDEIVDKHRNREVVEQLFDQLIESLEKLIACDELDSRRVIMDLERLLATIRNAKSGSFHSQLLSIRVAKTYTKNLVKSWIRNTKIAKVMLEAADETAVELGITLDEAREKIQDEISDIERGLAERLIDSAPKSLESLPKSDSDSEEK